MKKIRNRDVKTEVTFLTTEDGGRRSPAATGYRGQFHYDGDDWIAEWEFVGCGQVAPGETAEAYLRLASPERHLDALFIGMPFLIREGSRIVARGFVLDILDLAASAERRRPLLEVSEAIRSTLSGDVHLIDGCRDIIRKLHYWGLAETQDSLAVLGFVSQTDHIPRGSLRDECSPDFGAAADAEAEEWRLTCEKEIFDHLKTILKTLNAP